MFDVDNNSLLFVATFAFFEKRKQMYRKMYHYLALAKVESLTFAEVYCLSEIESGRSYSQEIISRRPDYLPANSVYKALNSLRDRGIVLPKKDKKQVYYQIQWRTS